MEDFIARLKTFVAYWMFGGFLSCIMIMLFIFGMGTYSYGLNMLTMIAGQMIAITTYVYRRKNK